MNIRLRFNEMSDVNQREAKDRGEIASAVSTACSLRVYEVPSISVTPLHKAVRNSTPGVVSDGGFGFVVGSP